MNDVIFVTETEALVVSSLPSENIVVGELDTELLEVSAQGPAGPPGPSGTGSGSGGATILLTSLLFNAAAQPGQPVYLGQVDGQARMASAAAFATSPAVGLVSASVAGGFVQTVQTAGEFALSDWTQIAGTALLTRGATYYLSPVAGKLTSTAPTQVGSCVVFMGVAASPTTLTLSPTRPILL